MSPAKTPITITITPISLETEYYLNLLGVVMASKSLWHHLYATHKQHKNTEDVHTMMYLLLSLLPSSLSGQLVVCSLLTSHFKIDSTRLEPRPEKSGTVHYHLMENPKKSSPAFQGT